MNPIAEFKIPALAEVESAWPALIEAAQKHFASPPVTTATFTTGESSRRRPAELAAFEIPPTSWSARQSTAKHRGSIAAARIAGGCNVADGRQRR
jgi:hypothetical protein